MNPSSLISFAQHLFISSSALLLAGFAVYGLVRRRPAAARELLWRTVFSVLMLLPLAWFLKPWGMIPETTPAERRLARIEMLLNGEPAKVSTPPPLNESRTAPADGSPVSIATILLSLWVAGAVLLLARTAGGTFLRRRWLSRARTCSGTRAETVWRALSGPSGARVLLSTACPVPLTWGRTVILPEEALTWPDDQLRAALQHEAAHMRRRDSFFRRMGEFATALLWLQPLLWPARRLWHRMQEQACDDAVIREGADAAAYAELLCQAARAWTREVPGALAMAQPSSLEKRIRAVMNPDGDRRLCSRRNLMAALVAGGLTFTCAALAQKPDAPSPAKPAKPPAAADSAAKVKALNLVVPRIQFAEVSLDQAIAFVKAKSKELDPDKKGISIKGPPGKAAKTVTLDMRNIRLWDLLSVIAEYTDTHLEDGPDGILFKDGAAPPLHASPPENSAIRKKAEAIRIPKVEFDMATVDEMVTYVRLKTADGSPKSSLLNIVVKNAGPDRYSLSLSNVSAWEVIDKIADQAHMTLSISKGAGDAESILLDRGEISSDEIGIPDSVVLSPQYRAICALILPAGKAEGTLADAVASFSKNITAASSGKLKATFRVDPAIANVKYARELPPGPVTARFAFLADFGKYEWSLDGNVFLLRARSSK